MRKSTTAVALVALVAASPASAYLISAQAIGAAGIQDSYDLATVEVSGMPGDAFGNSIDGYASTGGDSGAMNGHMKVHIADYAAAQNSSPFPDFLAEKRWKSIINETIEHIQLDPGATELVVRLRVSAEDLSDLTISPNPLLDNGYAMSHVLASLTYTNKSSHTAGLDSIVGTARADRSVPGDWTEIFGGDTQPPGYGTASSGDASAMVEFHIPASEVNGSDTLLVVGQPWAKCAAATGTAPSPRAS